MSDGSLVCGGIGYCILGANSIVRMYLPKAAAGIYADLMPVK